MALPPPKKDPLLAYPAPKRVEETLRELQRQAADKFLEASAARPSGPKGKRPDLRQWLERELAGSEQVISRYVDVGFFPPLPLTQLPFKLFPVGVDLTPVYRDVARGVIWRDWIDLVRWAEKRLYGEQRYTGRLAFMDLVDPDKLEEHLDWVRIVRFEIARALVGALDYERVFSRFDAGSGIWLAQRVAVLLLWLKALPIVDAAKSMLKRKLFEVVVGAPLDAARNALGRLRDKLTDAEEFGRGSGFDAWIGLIRAAELKLIEAGHNDIDERIQMLSSIYYASPWSKDQQEEGSTNRSRAFRAYIRRTLSFPLDPRPVLGAALFSALQKTQDVAGVDVGHVIFGLDARMSPFLDDTVFEHGATGLEIGTWAGDLGGGAAQLALARALGVKRGPSHYFRLKDSRGKPYTDYGASSNLEGDVAAYAVGTPAGSTHVAAPRWPDERIFKALENHFVLEDRGPRFRLFLALHGARFEGDTLANREAVLERLYGPIYGFSRPYLVQWLKKTYSPITALRLYPQANRQRERASREIATMFLEWLVAHDGRIKLPAPPRKRRAR